MERSEIEAAIGEVARKHNLLLSSDDPLLVMLTLNDVILERMLAKQSETLEACLDQISAGAAQQAEAARVVAGVVITGAADYVAGELRETATMLKAELLAAIDARKQEIIVTANSARQAQRIAGYAALACIAALGVMVGVAIGVMLEPAPSAVMAPRPQGGTTARQ
jgi:hypothetical protein